MTPESYGRLLGDERAQMVFTDPPWNIPIAGNVSGLGAVKHDDFVMACGEMSAAEFEAFLRTALGNAARIRWTARSTTFAWAGRRCASFSRATDGIYSELKNLCVWCKPNGGMGSLYRSAAMSSCSCSSRASRGGTLVSRLNDKATGSIIGVMQRLHEEDLAGHLREQGGWDCLELPAIALDDEVIPLGHGLMHCRRAGDILHPERESRAALEAIGAEIGSLLFSAQKADPAWGRHDQTKLGSAIHRATTPRGRSSDHSVLGHCHEGRTG